MVGLEEGRVQPKPFREVQTEDAFTQYWHKWTRLFVFCVGCVSHLIGKNLGRILGGFMVGKLLYAACRPRPQLLHRFRTPSVHHPYN